MPCRIRGEKERKEKNSERYESYITMARNHHRVGCWVICTLLRHLTRFHPIASLRLVVLQTKSTRTQTRKLCKVSDRILTKKFHIKLIIFGNIFRKKIVSSEKRYAFSNIYSLASWLTVMRFIAYIRLE